MDSEELLKASEAAERWPMMCNEILDTLRAAMAIRIAGDDYRELVSQAKRLAGVLESDFRKHRKAIVDNIGFVGFGEDSRPTDHLLSLESSRVLVSAINMCDAPEMRMSDDPLDIVADGSRWSKLGRDDAMRRVERVRNERVKFFENR